MCKLANTDVINKTWKELEYILYLSKVKIEANYKWSEFVKKTLLNKKDPIE